MGFLKHGEEVAKLTGRGDVDFIFGLESLTNLSFKLLPNTWVFHEQVRSTREECRCRFRTCGDEYACISFNLPVGHAPVVVVSQDL